MGRPLGSSICIKGHDKNITGRVNRGCCKLCIREYQRVQRKAWRKENPNEGKNGKWRRYGIIKQDGSAFTLVDYDREYQIQKGACKICGIHQSELGRSLAVDHNHSTGIFRGLLCPLCNLLLGNAKDEEIILRKAINYLVNS